MAALTRLRPGVTDYAGRFFLMALLERADNTAPRRHAAWCRAAGVDPALVATVQVGTARGWLRGLSRAAGLGETTATIRRRLPAWFEHRLVALRRGVLFIFWPHIVALDEHANRAERARRVDWPHCQDDTGLVVETPTDDHSHDADDQPDDPQPDLPIDPDRIGRTIRSGSLRSYMGPYVRSPQPPTGGQGESELERLVRESIPVVGEHPPRGLSIAERRILADLVEAYGAEHVEATARAVCPGRLWPVQHLGKTLDRQSAEARVEATEQVERRPQASSGEVHRGRRRRVRRPDGWAEVGRRVELTPEQRQARDQREAARLAEIEARREAEAAELRQAEAEAEQLEAQRVEAEQLRAEQLEAERPVVRAKLGLLAQLAGGDAFDATWRAVQRAQVARDRDALDCEAPTRRASGWWV